ncbi:MAG TPA: ribosomal protein S18-alanine N-acetyltransferase [Burkholderiales bacterium]|nr:ribosomal protein S18-alanine N-acetyltransferase [Burkholderiales bacterium]
MSAQLETMPAARPMRLQDLDAVIAIENRVYPFPWTRGNFRDSISAGYDCRVFELAGVIIGYGVVMRAVDEAHLLNLSVAANWQGRGYGRALLRHFMSFARDGACNFISLEVRPSNLAAIRLYQSEGFREIAVRRGYYPAERGREDAIVMGRAL